MPSFPKGKASCLSGSFCQLLHLYIMLSDKYVDLTEGVRHKRKVDCKLFSGILYIINF